MVEGYWPDQDIYVIVYTENQRIREILTLFKFVVVACMNRWGDSALKCDVGNYLSLMSPIMFY
jgi:hypothetical protein